MRAIVHARVAIGLVGVLLLAARCLHAAPSATHASLIAQVEQRLMGEHPDNPIKQIHFDAGRLTTIIHDRIDAGLLKDNPRIEATDLQVTWPYQKRAVTIITLTYPTPAIASRQAGRLSTLTHLRNTKVLAPLAHSIVDDTLVILFTESGLYSVISAFTETLNAKPAANPSPLSPALPSKRLPPL